MNQVRRDLLVHPAFVGAVALLAVNDHLLKWRWPGPVTGKLSDVAGVFVAAVVLALVARRRDVGLALAAAGFAALKTVPPAAVAAAPLLGGVTLSDPTDLVALVALLPAHRFLAPLAVARRIAPATPPAGATGAAGPTRRGQDGVIAGLRSVAAVAVLGVTMLSVTSTSCLDVESVVGLQVDGSDLVAVVDVGRFGNEEAGDAYRSTDGGRTWTAEGLWGQPLSAGPPGEDEVCTTVGTCYRVAGGNRVEQSAGDGGWSTAFEFSDEEIQRMVLRVNDCEGTSPEPVFGPLALVDGPDGETVVVSAGPQGVLRLESGSSTWTRHAVGPAEPISTAGPSWLRHLYLAPLVALVLGPLLALVAGQGASGPQLVVSATVALALQALIGGMVVLLLIAQMLDYAVGGPVTAATSLVALALSSLLALVLARHNEQPHVPAQPAGGRPPPAEGVSPPAEVPEPPAEPDRIPGGDD